MKKRRRTALAVTALLGVVAFAFVYTRPLIIEQRYPVLDLSQCTLIHGYFNDGTGVEDIPFAIAPDDPRFGDVIELVQTAEFRTDLWNILPKGTKFHTYKEDDFKWLVRLRFEDVLFPNGDTGSGDMLHIHNFFGEVELFFDGSSAECSVKNQEQWLEDVMSILVQGSD